MSGASAYGTHRVLARFTPRFRTLDDIRARNRAAGGKWFDPSNMRFFGTRLQFPAVSPPGHPPLSRRRLPPEGLPEGEDAGLVDGEGSGPAALLVAEEAKGFEGFEGSAGLGVGEAEGALEVSRTDVAAGEAEGANHLFVHVWTLAHLAS